MSNSSGDRKISELLAKASIDTSGVLTFVENGTNYKISLADFLASIGVTGTIEQVGDPLGTPILNKAGSVNSIRNLEAGAGVNISVSPQNGAAIEHNFLPGSGGVPVLTDETLPQPTIRSISAGTGIAVGAQNGSIVVSLSGAPTPLTKVVVVNQPSDFPNAVGGVRTLEGDTVYLIQSFVDMGTDRFVAQADTVVKGTSPLVNGVSSDTTGTLFSATSGGDFELSGLKLSSPNGEVFDYVSPAPLTGVIVFENVRIEDCATIATLGNFAGASFKDILVETTSVGGGVFTGTNGIGNFDTISVVDFTGTLFDLNSQSPTFQLFSIETTSITSGDIANVIVNGLPNSGNINVGGQGVVRNVNLFGTFTDPGNIVSSDLRWNFSLSNVFPDSVNRGYSAMPNNATATTFSAANTPTLVLGTWTPKSESRFSADAAGRLTYIGSQPIEATISFTCTCEKTGSGTETFNLYIALNGVVQTDVRAQFATDNTRDPNVALVGIIDMNPNDYVEIYAENTASTNSLTVTAANFVGSE